MIRKTSAKITFLDSVAVMRRNTGSPCKVVLDNEALPSRCAPPLECGLSYGFTQRDLIAYWLRRFVF